MRNRGVRDIPERTGPLEQSATVYVISYLSVTFRCSSRVLQPTLWDKAARKNSFGWLRQQQPRAAKHVRNFASCLMNHLVRNELGEVLMTA